MCSCRKHPFLIRFQQHCFLGRASMGFLQCVMMTHINIRRLRRGNQARLTREEASQKISKVTSGADAGAECATNLAELLLLLSNPPKRKSNKHPPVPCLQTKRWSNQNEAFTIASCRRSLASRRVVPSSGCATGSCCGTGTTAIISHKHLSSITE